MPGTGKADVSPSQFDMQWRSRVDCEEFWATFPVFSPRPGIHTEGLIPIRVETGHFRKLVGSVRGKPCLAGDDVSACSSQLHSSRSRSGSEATPQPPSRQSFLRTASSPRSSLAAAALVLDAGAADMRNQLQQERVLRQKAEDEVQQLRAKLATYV
ncbi:unnamed protein product [Durusdinium trenchii]|uniref:Mitogen-activated protein kinase n=2 Tax=Durusdinium trenchii TaxID=1381693 RepID=A0ABP0KJU2_9DINO